MASSSALSCLGISNDSSVSHVHVCLVSTRFFFSVHIFQSKPFFVNVRRRRGHPRLAQLSPDWSYLLTAKQRQYLDVYLERFSRLTASARKDWVCDLTQNPKERPSQSSSSGSMPTLRHSGSLFWAPSLRRWLLPCELAAASGFPVFAELATAAGMPRDTSLYSTSQLGNGMHVATVGSVFMVAMACLKPL